LAVSDLGDWPRAVECFARAVAVNPDVPDGLTLLGDALARCGRRDEAIAAFREAVRAVPPSSPAGTATSGCTSPPPARRTKPSTCWSTRWR
jgi:tetratricopeptide (TPR) repeat protein